VRRGRVKDEFALAHKHGQREVEFRFAVFHGWLSGFSWVMGQFVNYVCTLNLYSFTGA